jgi:ABC-type transporter Mla subunit MlaD
MTTKHEIEQARQVIDATREQLDEANERLADVAGHLGAEDVEHLTQAIGHLQAAARRLDLLAHYAKRNQTTSTTPPPAI